MNFSTGLRRAILDAGLREAFTNPVLQLREGAPPDTADQATIGDLVCELTLPTSDYFTAASAEGQTGLNGSWVGTVQSSGTAGWFRLKDDADAGAASSVAVRIDGLVGVDSGDILLESVVLAFDDEVQLLSFAVSLSGSALSVAAGGVLD